MHLREGAINSFHNGVPVPIPMAIPIRTPISFAGECLHRVRLEGERLDLQIAELERLLQDEPDCCHRCIHVVLLFELLLHAGGRQHAERCLVPGTVELLDGSNKRALRGLFV